MKKIIVVLLACFFMTSLLLSGCATNKSYTVHNPEISFPLPKADYGLVALSIDCYRFNSSSVLFYSALSPHAKVNKWFGPGTWIDYDCNGRTQYKLLALPADKYEFSYVSFDLLGDSKLSIPFSVSPNKVTYIGNLVFLVKKDNKSHILDKLLSMSYHSGKILFGVRNYSRTDIKVFKRLYKHLKNAPFSIKIAKTKHHSN